MEKKTERLEQVHRVLEVGLSADEVDKYFGIVMENGEFVLKLQAGAWLETALARRACRRLGTLSESCKPLKGCLHALLQNVRIEENQYFVKKETLLEIAKSILSGYDFSSCEYRDAVSVLAKYHLVSIVDRRHPRECQELIEKERAKMYYRRCLRCGLPISSKRSVQSGFGHVCREKGDVLRLLSVENRKEART